MAAAPDLLAGAKRLDLATVRRHDHARPPDTAQPAGFRKIVGNARVGFQLGLDGLEHLCSLLKSVHHDDGVPLGPGDQAPRHKAHADLGGLGLATRGRNRIALARRSVHYLGQALVEVLVQLAGLGPAIVREVVAIPILVAIDRVTDLAAALGNGGRIGIPAVQVSVDLLAQVIGQRCQACQKVLAVLGHGYFTLASSSPNGSSISTKAAKCCG